MLKVGVCVLLLQDLQGVHRQGYTISEVKRFPRSVATFTSEIRQPLTRCSRRNLCFISAGPAGRAQTRLPDCNDSELEADFRGEGDDRPSIAPNLSESLGAPLPPRTLFGLWSGDSHGN